MKKIPTYFVRDYENNPGRVLPVVNPACDWVAAGEGIATKKLDGTCCRILDQQLFKRRELKRGVAEPVGFTSLGTDPITGKTVGWLPVSLDPCDKWHRLAFVAMLDGEDHDGTYELLGPKIQGNKEGQDSHVLVPHNDPRLYLEDVPLSFGDLSMWFADKNIEGVVWHHPDGRMAKLKGVDLGWQRYRDGPKQDQ